MVRKTGRGRHDYTYMARCPKCKEPFPRDFSVCPNDGTKLRFKPRMFHSTIAFTEDLSDSDRRLVVAHIRERLLNLVNSEEFFDVLMRRMNTKTMDALLLRPKDMWKITVETTLFNRDLILMFVQSKTGERKVKPTSSGNQEKIAICHTLDGVDIDRLSYHGDPKLRALLTTKEVRH